MSFKSGLEPGLEGVRSAGLSEGAAQLCRWLASACFVINFSRHRGQGSSVGRSGGLILFLGRGDLILTDIILTANRI